MNNNRNVEDYPPGGGPPPKATPGTWAVICLLIAIVIGGTATIHTNSPPAQEVAEAP